MAEWPGPWRSRELLLAVPDHLVDRPPDLPGVGQTLRWAGSEAAPEQVADRFRAVAWQGAEVEVFPGSSAPARPQGAGILAGEHMEQGAPDPEHIGARQQDP